MFEFFKKSKKLQKEKNEMQLIATMLKILPDPEYPSKFIVQFKILEEKVLNTKFDNPDLKFQLETAQRIIQEIKSKGSYGLEHQVDLIKKLISDLKSHLKDLNQ